MFAPMRLRMHTAPNAWSNCCSSQRRSRQPQYQLQRKGGRVHQYTASNSKMQTLMQQLAVSTTGTFTSLSKLSEFAKRYKKARESSEYTIIADKHTRKSRRIARVALENCWPSDEVATIGSRQTARAALYNRGLCDEVAVPASVLAPAVTE